MRNGGLARIMEGQWHNVQPIPGRAALPITGIAEIVRANGVRELWFGTDGRGVVRAREGRWTVFDQAGGFLPNDNVVCLYSSRSATGEAVLWVGVRNGGLVRFDGHAWSRLNRASGALPNDLVQAVLETVDETGTRTPVSYTHLRAHETVLDLVCRLLLEKKQTQNSPHKNDDVPTNTT